MCCKCTKKENIASDRQGIIIGPGNNNRAILDNTLLPYYGTAGHFFLSHTSKQSTFCLFFASSNVSFGSMREVLHRFNGCAKIWSTPGAVYSKEL